MACSVISPLFLLSLAYLLSLSFFCSACLYSYTFLWLDLKKWDVLFKKKQLGTVVEDFCARYLSLPVPSLTSAQRQLRSVRFANQLGCAIGLVIGCIIGMFPLLILDSNHVQAMKRQAALDSLFQDVVTEAGGLVNAQRTRLYIVCRRPGHANDKNNNRTSFLLGGCKQEDWIGSTHGRRRLSVCQIFSTSACYNELQNDEHYFKRKASNGRTLDSSWTGYC